MNESLALSTILIPLVEQFKPRSLLIAGGIAETCLEDAQDTRSATLTTPYRQSQLQEIEPVDVAVISDLTETLSRESGQQWLGTLRNLFAPHIILISDPQKAEDNGWEFADFLALGLEHFAGSEEGLQVFSYAIENYQPHHEWLNARFWANPENFDKYRW